MAESTIYRAPSWQAFSACKAAWATNEPVVMVIPDLQGEKNRVARLFPGLSLERIVTITDLIERYTTYSLGDKRLLSLPNLEALIASLLKTGIAPYLNIEQNRQGYVRALTAFINNFRRTTTLSLKSAFDDFAFQIHNFREKDLITLYNEYEQRLHSAGYDFRSAVEDFIDHVSTNGEGSTKSISPCRACGFEENTRFVFFGFTSLTPLEREFASTVFKLSPGTIFLHCTDQEASEQALRVESSLELFMKQAGVTGSIDLTPQYKEFGLFDLAARQIFQPINTTPPGNRPAITLIRPNNRYTEICDLAERIRELLAQGAQPASMRVVIAEYELYATMISETFGDYAIPFTLDRGLPLLLFPVAAVLNDIASLGFIANPYPVRERVLSSPYITCSAEASPEELLAFQQEAGVFMLDETTLREKAGPGGKINVTLDAHYVLNLLRRAYRQGGSDRELPALELARRYLDTEYRTQEGAKVQAYERCLFQLYALEKAEKALSFPRTKMSAEEFREAMTIMLNRFNVEKNIAFSGKSLFDGSEPGSAEDTTEKRDRLIISSIKTILERMVRDMPGNPAGEQEEGDNRRLYTLQELTRAFTRLLEEARLTVPPDLHADQSVSIEPLEQGFFRRAEYNFILGLVDGAFPAREEFNFLQPKKEGLGLGLSYTSVDYARNRLYHLLRSTNTALYVSAPLTHNGRSLPPSPFYGELEKLAADKAVQKIPEADRPARHSTPNTDEPPVISTLQDKLLYISKNVDDDYDRVKPHLKEMREKDPSYYRRVEAVMRHDGLTMSAATFSEFDGLLTAESYGKEDHVSTLLAQILDTIAFDPTVLERYAACPLRFFLDNILHLKKEPDFDADQTERGLLVRELLCAYSHEAAEKKQVPDNAAKIFLEKLETHFADQEERFIDAFEARFKNQLLAGLEDRQAKRPGLFASFLDFEKNCPDLLEPYLGPLPGQLTIKEDLHVNIPIDRVDLAPAISKLLLYHYSSAQRGDVSKTLRGLRFTLPLALVRLQKHAAEQLPGMHVGAGGIYQVTSPRAIRRGGYIGLNGIRSRRQNEVSPDKPIFSGQNNGFFKQEDDLQKFLELTLERTTTMHEKMKSGVYHLPLCAEKDQSCATCSFLRICRKEQLRLDRLYFNLKKRSDLHIV